VTADAAIADLAAAVPGSFRDPCGRMLTIGGRLVRQIDFSYQPHFEQLMASGLYSRLIDESLLVAHDVVTDVPAIAANAFAVIEPQRIPFVSYPFEWTASQLREAALTTLRIQRLAIEHGMTLKDASAYNVQFRGTAPVFIDTLSFERWDEGTPWLAYRQFCQHFLGPLALMTHVDPRLGTLARIFIDGAPLDLIGRLLPFSSRLTPGLLVHLHLHNRSQSRHAGAPRPPSAPRFGRRSMLGLIDHLESAIERLSAAAPQGSWSGYYAGNGYSTDAMADKACAVAAAIDVTRPAMVWDFGCNTGRFAQIAAERGAYTVALDADYGCVERVYAGCRDRRDTRVLPLVMDLTNPSARLGWNHDERLSLVDRGPADMGLALGLIHHLYFANQLSFAAASAFFRQTARMLAIEFVPPDDAQVVDMAANLPGRCDGYTVDEFERAFAVDFMVGEPIPLRDSSRRLYVMRRRDQRP
jgi:hypothetical protein